MDEFISVIPVFGFTGRVAIIHCWGVSSFIMGTVMLFFAFKYMKKEIITRPKKFNVGQCKLYIP